MSEENLVVVAVIKPKPQKRSALRQTLESLIGPVRAEKGCIRYELSDVEDGDAFMFCELWQTKEDWEEHMNSPHIEEFKSAADELVGNLQIFTASPI